MLQVNVAIVVAEPEISVQNLGPLAHGQIEQQLSDNLLVLPDGATRRTNNALGDVVLLLQKLVALAQAQASPWAKVEFLVAPAMELRATVPKAQHTRRGVSGRTGFTEHDLELVLGHNLLVGERFPQLTCAVHVLLSFR